MFPLRQISAVSLLDGIPREDNIKALQTEKFDLLVIGGGSTGAGAALDARSRGLSVAWVEREDFSSGTSSRSTKLIHGGVRYLEQAILKLDKTQWNLVRDALKERSVLLKTAPHLSRPLGLLTPLYSRLEIPYYTAGLKIYDLLAGISGVPASRLLSRQEVEKEFPAVKKEGLKGGVLYYDGQFDDARMNIALATTAAEHGAKVANYLEVIGLLKKEGKLVGAKLRDNLSKQEWELSAKVVINATGPFADSIRRLDEPDIAPILKASSGTHLILDPRFSPPDRGVLIPKTSDGRVVFILPWNGYTLVGTTDNPAEITAHPKPSSDDIDYILTTIARYFDNPPKRIDVLSQWTGLRPLVSDPKAADTARLSRDHVIEVSRSGLVTIAGGKWTTYRKMALDVIDHAVALGSLKPTKRSWTQNIPVAGGENFSDEIEERLTKNFALDRVVASHLVHSYGSRAIQVAEIAQQGFGNRLHPQLAYLEAEVVYGVEVEAARRIADILARRTRMGFLDQKATLQAIPRVAEIMSHILKWSESQKAGEISLAKDYFN